MRTSFLENPSFKSPGLIPEEIIRAFENATQSTLHDKRNIIRQIQWSNHEWVVKKFKTPNVLQGYIYGSLRKSKAKRSFEHAVKLLQLNITTPKPVAAIEQYNAGRLCSSYYVCEHHPHEFSMQAVLNTHTHTFDAETKADIVSAFTAFTFQMHESGVLHQDHNAGNTLVNPSDSGWRFCIIDINRMRFKSLTLKDRLNNFVRLTDDRSVMLTIASTYADLMGIDEITCQQLLLKLKAQHLKKLAIKKRIKRIFRRHPTNE